MSIKKVTKKIAQLSFVFFLTFGFVLSPVSADSQVTPFKDNFNHLYLKPDNHADWWIINWGIDELGGQGIFEDFCGSTTCISQENEVVNGENDGFVRMTLDDTTEAGIFANVDLAEEHTGHQDEIVNQWAPTESKDVEIESTVRWGAGYNQAGTGGAEGTNGVWLWNSPFDNDEYNPLPGQIGFGFNWTPSDTLGGYVAGLKLLVIYYDFPIYVADVPFQIDMQDWNTFKQVWSVDNGVEKVTFYVNDQYSGEFVLPTSFGKLSTEIWQDNEDPVLTETGFEIQYADILFDQQFDLTDFSLRYVDANN